MNLPQNKTHLKNEFYSWLNKNQFSYKKIISDALDEVYRIDKLSVVTEEGLISIRSCLELPYLISYPIGGYCCEFAMKYSKIEKLLMEISRHSNASVRRNMLIVCFYNQPQQLVDTILKNGLEDRSKSVRYKAIDVICRLNKKHLKQNLKDRLSVEENIEIKRELENSYGLMDCGYAIDESSNRVHVQLKNGERAGIYLSNVDVTNKKELERAVIETRKLKNY